MAAAQPGAAPQVDHQRDGRTRAQDLGDGTAHQRGRGVVEPAELGVEGLGETVEHGANIVVRSALGHPLSGVGREIVRRLRVGRVFGVPLLVELERLLVHVQRVVGRTQHHAQHFSARRGDQALHTLLDGVVQPAVAQVQAGQVLARVGEVGPLREQRLEGGFRPGDVAAPALQHGQVVDGVVTPRFQRDGAAVMRLGLAVTLGLLQRVAQVVVEHGLFGQQRRGAADELDGACVVAQLAFEHAQHVQAVGVLGVGGEQCLVAPAGLVEVAVPMHRHRLREHGGCAGTRRSAAHGAGRALRERTSTMKRAPRSFSMSSVPSACAAIDLKNTSCTSPSLPGTRRLS